jgi:hypothetical protein
MAQIDITTRLRDHDDQLSCCVIRPSHQSTLLKGDLTEQGPEWDKVPLDPCQADTSPSSTTPILYNVGGSMQVDRTEQSDLISSQRPVAIQSGFQVRGRVEVTLAES